MVNLSQRKSRRALDTLPNASTNCRQESKVKFTGDRRETASSTAGLSSHLDLETPCHTLMSVSKTLTLEFQSKFQVVHIQRSWLDLPSQRVADKESQSNTERNLKLLKKVKLNQKLLHKNKNKLLRRPRLRNQSKKPQ